MRRFAFFHKNLLVYVFLAVCLFLPDAAFAQFVPLIPVPGLTDATPDIEKYLRVLYIVAIGAAALLAVAKLILAGFKYVTSSIVSNKESAKKDIWSALLGLLIVLIAVVLLTTLNPALTNLPALNPLEHVNGPPKQRAVVIKDGVEIENKRAECETETKKSEGYEFRIHTSGTWDKPVRTFECCIPGSTGESKCSVDGSKKDETSGVTIETTKEYSRDEFDALLGEIRKSGSKVTYTAIIGGNEEREGNLCTAQGGEVYIVQRKTNIPYRPPERLLLCVTKS